jgi:hypothetical protein
VHRQVADTLVERRDSSARWTWRETVRVAVPVVLVLLTAVRKWTTGLPEKGAETVRSATTLP